MSINLNSAVDSLPAESVQDGDVSKWFWFSHQTTEITSDLNIIVYLISPTEMSSYLHLSKDGLASGTSLEKFWAEVPPVGPGNDVVRFEPVNAFNVAGVMMFTENQQLFIGNLPDDAKLEIYTWRSVNQRAVLSGRVLLTAHAKRVQVFVKQHEVDSSYVLSCLANAIAEVESINTDGETDLIGSASENSDEQIEVIETHLEERVSTERIVSTESRMNRRPKKFWTNRRAKRATTIVRTILLSILGFVTLLVLTPLGLVHPTLPNESSSSVVITLPSRTPVHAGEELVVVIGQDIIRGKVSMVGSSTVQIVSGSSMTEVQMQDVIGRVVVSIPFIGHLL